MPAINSGVADKLREVADLLALQDASPYRVAAYRRGAATIDALEEDLTTFYAREGLGGFTSLPGIDVGIGAAVRELVRTGRLTLLDRLRGQVDPEALFQSIPGVGPRMARLIHDVLAIETLEELEAAAHDGRLERVPGLGPRRVQVIRAALGEKLGRLTERHHPPRPEVEPPVELLLDVDREYRERAAAGNLPRIAPRRFNPDHERWLPILHTQRGDWHFTALFSNTARAHALGKTRDWVIIYFYDGDHREQQRTVVTESRGALEGRRVVRGREMACLHAAQGISKSPTLSDH